MEKTYQDSALKTLCEKLRHEGEILRYQDMVYHSGVDADHRWETITKPKTDCGTISYGDLDRHRESSEVTWDWMFCPSYMTYSDYSGSTCERSNCAEFLHQFGETPGVYEMTGGYGTTGVAILLSAITDEMMEIFDALQNYPVVDEDALSKLEMEIEEEDWASWISSDFKRAMKKVLLPQADADKEEALEDHIDALPDVQLYTLYLARCEETNIYWEIQDAISGYVNVDTLVKGMTIHDLPFEGEEGV